MKIDKVVMEAYKKIVPWVVFILFVLILLIMMAASLFIEKQYNLSTTTFRGVFTASGYLVPVMIFYFYYKNKFQDLSRIFAFSLKYLFFGILLKLALSIFHDFLPEYVIMNKLQSLPLSQFTSILSWEMAGRIVMPVLLGPVFEELFFRGILLRLFAEYYSRVPAIVFSSVAFALLHIAPMQGESHLIFILNNAECLLFGILLASITYKTKNISFACGFHVANNFLAMLAK